MIAQKNGNKCLNFKKDVIQTNCVKCKAFLSVIRKGEYHNESDIDETEKNQ